jgi:hypothetical protein
MLIVHNCHVLNEFMDYYNGEHITEAENTPNANNIAPSAEITANTPVISEREQLMHLKPNNNNFKDKLTR